MSAARLPQLGDLLVQILLLGFVFLLGCFDLENGDIWWHLRTGQLIWERGEVPRTDWFTYTNPESVWLDLHWGFQVLAAKIYGSSGSAGLILFKCLLTTLAIFLCLRLAAAPGTNLKDGKSEGEDSDNQEQRRPVLACCLWLAPLIVIGWRYTVRPEMLSILLLVCTLTVLFRSRRSPRVLWLLPLIQLLWVNVQGLFILQYAVVGCFALEQIARRLGNRGLSSDGCTASLRQWSGVSLGMIIASLLNPYLWRGALLPLMLAAKLRGANREFFFDLSGELKGFDFYVERFGFFKAMFAEWETTMFVLLALAVFLTLVLLACNGRFSIYRWLLFLGFGFLAWRMTRNAVLFAVVGGCVLNWNVIDLIGIYGRGKRRLSANSAVIWLVRVGVAAVLLGLIVSVVSGRYHRRQSTAIRRTPGLGEARWYCHDLGDFLHRDGLPTRIYASHLGIAAVCIYHAAPDKLVYADARLETNSREVLQNYQLILKQLMNRDDRVFQTLLYGTVDTEADRELPLLVLDTGALLSRPAILQGILHSNRWRCVYAQLHGDVSDPSAIREGVCVFMDKQLAEQRGFPAANIRPLLR